MGDFLFLFTFDTQRLQWCGTLHYTHGSGVQVRHIRRRLILRHLPASLKRLSFICRMYLLCQKTQKQTGEGIKHSIHTIIFLFLFVTSFSIFSLFFVPLLLRVFVEFLVSFFLSFFPILYTFFYTLFLFCIHFLFFRFVFFFSLVCFLSYFVLDAPTTLFMRNLNAHS